MDNKGILLVVLISVLGKCAIRVNRLGVQKNLPGDVIWVTRSQNCMNHSRSIIKCVWECIGCRTMRTKCSWPGGQWEKSIGRFPIVCDWLSIFYLYADMEEGGFFFYSPVSSPFLASAASSSLSLCSFEAKQQKEQIPSTDGWIYISSFSCWEIRSDHLGARTSTECSCSWTCRKSVRV